MAVSVTPEKLEAKALAGSFRGETKAGSRLSAPVMLIKYGG